MKHEPIPMTLNPDGTYEMDVPSIVDCVVEANILCRDLAEWGKLPKYLADQCARFISATDPIIDDHWIH